MTSVVNLSLFDLSHTLRELAVKALDVLRAGWLMNEHLNHVQRFELSLNE